MMIFAACATRRYLMCIVPVRLRFRCGYCDRVPDPLTQLSLEAQAQEMLWGQYLDVGPEKWLVWHGRGFYGPTRYACPDHRGDLTAEVRTHYGTLGPHPWKMPPYPSSMRTADTDRAWPPAKFGLAAYGVVWKGPQQEKGEPAPDLESYKRDRRGLGHSGTGHPEPPRSAEDHPLGGEPPPGFGDEHGAAGDDVPPPQP
ncbi:MAG: hypothetical protein M3296_01495 [Actinomycetota bacterium]|nr:hypothetical protein [Actinomycetota bacterium]